MTEPIEFTSSTRRDEPIMFKLDGKDYGFRPPKRSIQMMPIYTGATDVDYMEARYDWLQKGLDAYDWSLLDETAKRAAHNVEVDGEGKAAPLPVGLPAGWQGPQSTELETRLRDDNDDFDVPDLEKVLDRLTTEVAGRPTT
jgi:hypothetical protein